MNKIDVEHKLLKGSPLDFFGKQLHHTLIGEMVDFKYGYTIFNQILGICVLDNEKFNKISLENGDELDGSAFWYFYFNISNELKTQVPSFESDGEKIFLFDIFIEFLKCLFHEEVTFNVNNGFIIGTENPIGLTDSNFHKFAELLKLRFGIDEKTNLNEDNPSNDRARALIEQRNKYREKLKKLKKGDDSDLTLTDLISIYSESAHMSPQYIYENYDMYQFNDQFNRLKIMLDYTVSIQSLLAGAKSEDVNLQHWISKIKKQEN